MGPLCEPPGGSGNLATHTGPASSSMEAPPAAPCGTLALGDCLAMARLCNAVQPSLCRSSEPRPEAMDAATPLAQPHLSSSSLTHCS